MLDVAASDHLLLSLSPSLVRKFGDLDGGCSAEELNGLLALVDDHSKRELLRKVFCLLLEGNVDGAEAHIDLSAGRIAPVEEYDPKNILEVFDGEDLRRIRVGSAEYEEWVKAFELRSTWHDWFLFLHPEQEAIVNADYAGVSQLSGVSGSGKTCVAVRRAMRLAKNDGASVLLLTLNRSLAGMLRQLVNAACSDGAVRSRIEVTSFFELTSALAAHMEKIGHKYTNILVDEAQDFGTTELAIVRMLVPEGANDIFLCGDVAQTVLPKQRSVVEAGLANITRERVRRNYRNSREILSAAYELLKANLHEELFESGDLEVLDPKFANFSDSAPVALAAESLEEEIAYARNYAVTHQQMGTRNLCIAFAGFSSRDVREYALKCGVTALDGAYDPNSDRLVFSDLEQTKGYEFDVLIVINCCEHVLPARDAPAEEGFRDICKLYVAMTRAKRELVLSFHGAASKWLMAVSGTISMDHWQTVENLDANLLQGTPSVLSELDPNVQAADSLSLTGTQFLYTSDALGLSPDAQEKLAELVDGKGLIRGGSGRRLKWPTIGSLLTDLLGPSIADEVRSTLMRMRRCGTMTSQSAPGPIPASRTFS
jgi:hypothetical protein